MLVANSSLDELAFGSDMRGMAIFTLQNDLKQIQYEERFTLYFSRIYGLNCHYSETSLM